MAIKSAFASALLLAQLACGGGNPSDPSQGSEVPLGTLRATFDGVPYIGTASAVSHSHPNASKPTIVTGTLVTFLFGFDLPDRIGTTSVGPGSVLSATFGTSDSTGAPSAVWSAWGTSGSGSVTVTTLTSTRTSGTFFFNLAPDDGATGIKVVTKGVFNVGFIVID